LRKDGVHIVEPDAGEMACGTIGPGRLSEPDRIVAAALELLGEARVVQDLSGEHLLITVGATREAIDPVRFISNRSSGRMGFALADAARRRGAKVTIVAGVTSATPPYGSELLRVQSAEEMGQAVMAHITEASLFIGAAAVADYQPAVKAAEKIKKVSPELLLKLERTPDILGNVAARRHDDQLIIGFAAETENIEHYARQKLQEKGLDAVIANDVTRTDAGFDAPTNAITIISSDRPEALALPLMSKQEAAHRILDEVVRLRRLGRNRPSVNKRTA
jgi:phosphopantothenoylcysteine decarboxylase/phosphopantothenate--cysteine ligase